MMYAEDYEKAAKTMRECIGKFFDRDGYTIKVEVNMDKIWITDYQDKFSTGKSMIYQCGECGQLTEFNTGYNKHNKEKHGAKDNIAFGFAEPQHWQELDIKEEDISN